jgi:hypothetical protein
MHHRLMQASLEVARHTCTQIQLHTEGRPLAFTVAGCAFIHDMEGRNGGFSTTYFFMA